MQPEVALCSSTGSTSSSSTQNQPSASLCRQQHGASLALAQALTKNVAEAAGHTDQDAAVEVGRAALAERHVRHSAELVHWRLAGRAQRGGRDQVAHRRAARVKWRSVFT